MENTTQLTGFRDLERAVKNKQLEVGQLIYQEIPMENIDEYKKELTCMQNYMDTIEYFHVAVFVGEYKNEFYVVEHDREIKLKNFKEAFEEAEKNEDELCKYFIVSPPDDGQGDFTSCFMIKQRALAAKGVRYNDASQRLPSLNYDNFATILIGDISANVTETIAANDINDINFKRFFDDIITRVTLAKDITLTLRSFFTYEEDNSDHKPTYLQFMKSKYIKLCEYVEYNRTKKCNKLLTDCLSPSTYKDFIERKTLLMHAAEKGAHNLCKILMNHNCEVNKEDYSGKTALMYAAEKGKVPVCELLLKNNSYVEGKNNEGLTALMFAAREKRRVVCETLIQAHVNVNSKNKQGCTALMLAATHGALEVTKLLLENVGHKIDQQDDEGRTAVMYATKMGHDKVLKELIKSNAKLDLQDKNGLTALMIAAVNSHENITTLLENRANVQGINDDKNTALMLAAGKKGNRSLVEQLREKEKNEGVNIDGKNNKGMTALMIAAMNGNDKIVKFLIEEGASLNAQNEDGNTPVMLATLNKHEGVAKLFINCEKEGNVNVRNNNGKTALMIAAKEGLDEIVKELFSANADVEIKDNEGNTVIEHLFYGRFCQNKIGKWITKISEKINEKAP